jgi:hypothetical protein
MGRISKGIMGDGDRLAPDEEPSLRGGIPYPRREIPPAGEGAAGDGAAGYDLVEEIAGYSARIAHLEAVRLQAIADLWSSDDMRPLSAPPAARDESSQKRRALRDLDRDDLTRAELMARLNLRAWDARRLIETATTLTRRFPRTLEALSQGQLDLTRASIIGEIGTPLADDRYDLALSTGVSPERAEQQARTVAGLLEDHILKRAPHQAPDNLRACLHRAVNRLDPGYADRHAKDTLKARQVTHRTRRGESTGELYA